ncbi:MAG: FAD-dependent oxidoreductase, partial [Clostridia bacterium]|nr:FAD-dependent oxidoreductase [Clostridia bacterium]
MIQLSNLTLLPNTDFSDLIALAAKVSGLSRAEILSCRLVKRSVDARKKPNVVFVCTIAIEVVDEKTALKKTKHKQTTLVSQKQNDLSIKNHTCSTETPMVVGSGPAGLFATLVLARAGCCPILIERGEAVDDRVRSVDAFWKQGNLNPNSNVQFGEGGAGTFSDGKLNTGTKDPRNRFVLETFVEHGAPEEILWETRPHVGTDKLVTVVRSMRKEIESLGGQVLF